MTTMAVTPRKRGLRGSEDGATAAEAALVLAVFVGTVLVIIDFAQAFFIWNTLQLVVGQASRYVMVQTSIPPPGSASVYCPPAGSASSCALSALTTLLPNASPNCSGPPESGEYCVNASCTADRCSLSALYGFKFLYAYTLSGQITVPIGLQPD
jgi:hypothetical protein